MAKPCGVKGRIDDLGGPWSLHLPGRGKEIHDNGSCRMVSPLRTGRIGDSPPFHGTCRMSGNPLTFHRRHTINAEDLCGDFYSAAENPSQRAPFSDLLDKRFSLCDITEVKKGLYRSTFRRYTRFRSPEDIVYTSFHQQSRVIIYCMGYQLVTCYSMLFFAIQWYRL